MFREWERLQLRDSDYTNHRIFTLRCIHKEPVPVIIRLKTTLRKEKAKKIITITEKQLLQVRIKSINSIIDNNAKQRELCRSKLVSILSTNNFRKCQDFIEKVGEFRFNKVKNRQVNKFNNLVHKKEGNITGVLVNSLQAGRQAGTNPPWDSMSSQVASTVPHNSTLQGRSFPGGKQFPGKLQFSFFSGRQVTPFPGTVRLPKKPAQSPLTALPPGKVLSRREAIPRQITI